MIITLKNANFSTNNIGTLSTYSIRFVGSGVTNSNTSVDRESNTGYTTTITLGTDYELNGSITVTMGGTDITSTAVSGLTINIPTKVTGNVVITVPTKTTAGGGDVVDPEPENPGSGEVVDPNLPTATTWYVAAASTSLGTECNTSNNSYGWAYADTTEQAAIRDKYINAIQFATTSTSGTVTIGIADENKATSVHSIQTTSFTKSGTSKEIVTAVFDTPFKLTGNQILVFEPSTVSQRNYNHYFGSQGSGAKSFLSRIPTDLANSNKQWASNTGNSIGISVGYYVEGSVEEPDSGDSGSTDANGVAWYTNKASASLANTCANDSNGWTYLQESDHNLYRNKPINYCRFATKSTSGTVRLGVATSKGGSEITNYVTGTFTKSNTNAEIVTVQLNNTLTVGATEYLVIEPYVESTDAFSTKTGKYSFQYGSGTDGFISRIPNDKEKDGATPWREMASYTIGWDFGYKAE